MIYSNNKNLPSNQYVYHNIYSYLPDKSKKSFCQTCKSFSTIPKVSEKIRSLYDFTVIYFNILASNIVISSSTDLLNVSAFLFGENHTNDLHTRLHNEAINQIGKIYKEKLTPIVESSTSTPLYCGQLRYVDGSIAKNNKGWDQRNSLVDEMEYNDINRKMYLGSFFLNVENLSFDEIVNTIHTLRSEYIFDKDKVNHLDGYPSSSSLLKQVEKNLSIFQDDSAFPKDKQKKAKICISLGVLILRAMLSRANSLNKSINLWCNVRDKGLVNTILKEYRLGNISASVAGSWHLTPGKCITFNKLKKTEIHYLALMPKTVWPDNSFDRIESEDNLIDTKTYASRSKNIDSTSDFGDSGPIFSLFNYSNSPTNNKLFKKFYYRSLKERKVEVKYPVFFFDQINSVEQVKDKIGYFEALANIPDNLTLSFPYYLSSMKAKILCAQLYMKGVIFSQDNEKFKEFLSIYLGNIKEFNNLYYYSQLNKSYSHFHLLLNQSTLSPIDKIDIEILKCRLLKKLRETNCILFKEADDHLKKVLYEGDETMLDLTSVDYLWMEKINSDCSTQNLTINYPPKVVEKDDYFLGNKEKQKRFIWHLDSYFNLTTFTRDNDTTCHKIMNNCLAYRKDQLDAEIKYLKKYKIQLRQVLHKKEQMRRNNTPFKKRLDFRN